MKRSSLADTLRWPRSRPCYLLRWLDLFALPEVVGGFASEPVVALTPS